MNNRIIGYLTGTAFILLIPLIAMQFTSEVNWTGMDFLVIAILLLGMSALYELAIFKIKSSQARSLIGLGFVLVTLLIWVQLAVGIWS